MFMMDWTKKNKFIILGIASPIITAALLASAFLISASWIREILALTGFVPFLLFLKDSHFSYRRVLLIAFLAGVVFFGITLFWLFSTLPLDWAGIESYGTGFTIFFFVWLFIITGFALWWGVFGVGSAYLLRIRPSHITFLWGVPSLWVITEYARSFMFGLLWFSPNQSSIGSDWTFSNLAYVFSDGPFASLVRYGGIYILDYLVVLLAAIIVLLIGKYTRKKGYIKIISINPLVLSVLYLIGFGIDTIDRNLLYPKNLLHEEKSIPIAAISIDFPIQFYPLPQDVYKRRERIAHIIKTLDQDVAIIVLPEIADFIDPIIYTDKKLMEVLNRSDPLVVDHGNTFAMGRSVGRTLYWRLTEKTFGSQSKSLPMPGGEYLPWIVRNGLSLFGQEAVVTVYDRTRTVYRAEKAPVVKDKMGIFSALLCSEAMSSRLTRKAVQGGAQLMFIQSSDAIFRGNTHYLNQMMAMAKLRAIESGRYIIRASNGGISAIIDPYGRVLQYFPKGNGSITGKVTLIDRSTLYTLWGDLPILLASSLGLAYVLQRGRFQLWIKKLNSRAI